MLELKDVSYYYKSQKDKTILNHVTYQFKKGVMYAILGSSGSGKTTLLSLLAGLDVPVEGTVCVAGEDILQRGLNDGSYRTPTLSAKTSGVHLSVMHV